MSMVASSIATIPAEDFHWYILFLEDKYNDPIKAELHSNFVTFGHEVGPDTMVVRGYDPESFYASVYETLTLYDDEWVARIERPALLVSDTAPRLLLGEPAKLNAAKLILIPLRPFRDKGSGAIVDLLRDLVAALKDDDAVSALQRLDRSVIKSKWGWLSRYLELKPNFMGFGLNLNAVLEESLSA